MTDITALMYRDKHHRELIALDCKERHAIEEQYHLMSEDGDFIVINQDIDTGSGVLRCGTLGYAYPEFRNQLYQSTIWQVDCLVMPDGDLHNYDLAPDMFDLISYEEYKARSTISRFMQVKTSEPVVKGQVVYGK